ncbi:hypothetical protein C8R46DRAFT_1345302, partial [Mycena filopes]
MADDKKDHKKGKDKKKKKKKETARVYHTVIEEADGTLVCSCSKFQATAKTCLQIATVRLYRDFGPPTRYSTKKASNSSTKREKPPKQQKGARLPADHLINDEHESFMRLMEDPDYNPFPAISDDETKEGNPPGTTDIGRPAAITAHQPGRSPTKFNKKPGPKGHDYNSLLPPLPDKSPKKSPVKVSNQSPSSSEDSSDSEPEVLPVIVRKGKGKAGQTLAAPAATEEDMDIVDINFRRWDNPDYTLRQDEEFEICQVINAIALGIRHGVLVIGDSYPHDAEWLRANVVWIASDEEPINSRGAPAFLDGSTLKNAWLHSQEITLQKICSYAKSHPFVSFATENMPSTHFSERILEFDSGRADDEIINIFVAIFAHRIKNVADNHFGTLFSRPPPTQDFKILTSFFLPKVLEALQQSEAEGNTNSSSPLSDSHRGKLLKWFKRDNLATLKRLFIPVNFPASVHWFLIVVYAATKKVIVYDSWEENYKNCQDETEVKRTPYAAVLAAIVPVIQLLSEASHGIFPQMSPEWAIQAELVPWQANVVDCGFFTIMFMLHLLYLDGINPTDCPPALRISGGAKMGETRVWLATKLIEWCSQNASSSSQTSQSGSALSSLESPTKSSQKAQAPEPIVIQREVIEVTDDTPDIPAIEVKEEPMEFELEVPTSDIEEEEELQAVNTEISSPLTPLSSSLPIVQGGTDGRRAKFGPIRGALTPSSGRPGSKEPSRTPYIQDLMAMVLSKGGRKPEMGLVVAPATNKKRG